MTDKKTRNYNFRAAIPTILRYIGVVGMIAAIVAVSIGFYLATSQAEFRSGEFPGELSDKVVGVINGYRRKESDNGVLKYSINADTAKTYDDGHQELDNIALRIFKDGDESAYDVVTANRAVYIPIEGRKDFTVFFAGNVDIKTDFDLRVKTDQLRYKSGEDVAVAEESVSFSRHNISGTSFGAVVAIGKNTLELSRDVFIEARRSETPVDTAVDLKIATLTAGYALVDGNDESILLRNGVSISLIPDAQSGLKQPSDIKSSVARVFLVDRQIRKLELEGNVDVKQKPTASNPGFLNARASGAEVLIDGDIERLGLFDGLTIESRKGAGEPVNARADSGSYEKRNETFELYDNVEIVTNRDTKKLTAIGSKAVYRQSKGEILLQGGASISQDGEVVKGDAINAELDNANALKYAKSTGNAFLRQSKSGRTTEVNGTSMQAWFAPSQVLKKADVRGETRVSVVPADDSEYSRFRLASPKGIDLVFGNRGFLSLLNTLGRTTLWLDAGRRGKSASDKTLTADTIKTTFRASGNELATAHAVGNAELLVVPRKPSAGIYRSKVTAPRFDCEFFAANQARSCASDQRGELRRKRLSGQGDEQILNANRLVSHFERETGDVRVFEAIGEAKFREGDKNGTAARINYTPPENLVELRGSNPMVWDSRSRAKAKAIDWNTESDTSVLTGSVSTTYFNQRQTGDAAPFTDKDSPVFATADTARFDHDERTAVYIGNARTWQGKNFVRGDKIYIEEVSGRFFAEGNVQSLIYETKRSETGKKVNLSVFVASRTMLYQRDRLQVRYEKNVDIRQGTERITGAAADVFLTDGNTVKYTVVSGDVVLTQPNRKGTGDYVKYDAVAETVELRGNPATFSDSESGTTNGKLITVDLKNNRAVNSGSSTRTGTGRTRSVYKLKGGRLN